ncbi:eukaryotic elongation factor 2 kinase-like isoform X2 [Uloborus diversus]|uniref:eukaryotic elongation factor 2 kinase-like isoform X2 n=1 Tax=Uloborus diversus TaxID=327109 RepID=UPI002409F136|nr:eukaryotic elongation factor 2 kinase-like isoform X2 [Uloborus diversus]
MEEEQFNLEIQALHLVERNYNVKDDDDHTNSSIFSTSVEKSVHVRQHWKEAAKKALHLSDPWEEFHLEQLETEVVCRYRFNAVRQTWVKDEVLVKIAKEPFGHGAMRSCYRLKKLSTFCHRQNWRTASNYVAKKYMEDVDRSVYFEDVKLQCEAKLWGEEYNRHNPPKKVDICQMSVIEFLKRPGKPLYHLEHFIEGDYIKYNSNSGFISCEKMRLTPQMSCITKVRGTEDICISPSNKERSHWKEYIRSRSASGNSPSGSFSFMSESSDGSVISNRECGFDISEIRSYTFDDNHDYDDEDAGLGPEENNNHFMFHSHDSGVESARGRRRRCESECSITDENEMVEFSQLVARQSRPSCVQNAEQLIELRESNENKNFGNSVLGYIHMDLIKYHEMGRFTPESQEYDHDAAFYHLKQAACCSNLEAVNLIAKIYLQIPHDLLCDITVPETAENFEIGMDYMKQAANAGDRASMIFLAKTYDSGDKITMKNWFEAVNWYEKAIKTEEADEGGEYDGCMDNPSYELIARQAELYRKGGFELKKNPSKAGELYNLAAEVAMSCMKGKLANKYYMLAEETFAEVEE